MKDGVTLGDAAGIPCSARTRISTHRETDVTRCNDLSLLCALSLCRSPLGQAYLDHFVFVENVIAGRTSVRRAGVIIRRMTTKAEGVY